jgi:hypothetical protein
MPPAGGTYPCLWWLPLIPEVQHSPLCMPDSPCCNLHVVPHFLLPASVTGLLQPPTLRRAAHLACRFWPHCCFFSRAELD